MSDINQFIYDQLTTSTGTNIMDSGDEDNRGWQKNQKKTLADFEAEPYAAIDDYDRKCIADGTYTSSSDLSPTVSTFHHLTSSLTLDALCDEFNAIPCEDWDSTEAYGLSEAGEQWLIDHRLQIESTWNSYNGETNLSQVLQGANIIPEGSSNFEFPEYILLQVHNGADVRGGYTDAKLYKVETDSGYFDTNPVVYGTIDGHDVETGYNGTTFTDGDGEAIEVKPESQIEVFID